MSYQALHACGLNDLMQPKILTGAVLSSLYLMAAYPMTQIYQHAEDARRGDKTLSILLGIKGTFLFTGILFGGVIALYAFYFLKFSTLAVTALFIASQVPAGIHFSRWGFRFFKGTANADFRNAMRLNTFASAGMNLFFAVLILMQKFAA
jgi:1,4-dihydroxy-2-naphthoate octaprenyltransferase